MDLNTIEDEICAFSAKLFKDVAFITEDGLDFIEDNQLHQPKENYTILFDYLSPIFNHFKSLDYSIIDNTLSKLYKDVHYLNKLHEEVKIKTNNSKDIFQKYILSKSPVISVLEQEINRGKKIRNITIEEKKILKKHLTNFEALKKIYYEIFKEVFSEDREFYLFALLQIINTKTYYLDKLIWIQAAKSETIMRNFKSIITDQGINSKIYITHKLKVIMPYSKDYENLQKCLRVFK